jgi:hypothetical protein
LSRFLVAMGMLFLNLLIYVALTLMLGTFFDSRPAVIGTAIFVLFLLIELAQDTTSGQFLPGSLLFAAGKMLAGNPFPYAIPRVGATDLSVLLVVAAFRRFGREEF